jgi:hypothetical protein
MRVVGATFSKREAAERALDELRRRLRLGRRDLAVAPLGRNGKGGEATVLAGRFHEEKIPVVRSLVEQHGGRIEIEVDERATQRWAGPFRGGEGGSLNARASRSTRVP